MGGVRRIQGLGVLLVLASAFGATFHLRAVPLPGPDGPGDGLRRVRSGVREVPARELAGAFAAALEAPVPHLPFWQVRRWYPWYLAPLWALALGLTAGAGALRRRRVGAGLLLLTCGLIALEAAYLKAEYLAFLPGWWGEAETLFAWIFVVAVLLWRRRADRGLGAVEATLAAQALLGLVHAVTLPSTLARQWLPRGDPWTVADAVLRNYPLPFWLGMLGMLLMAVPVYLRRTRMPSAGSPAVDS